MFNNFNGGLFGSPSTKGGFNSQVEGGLGTPQTDSNFVHVPYKEFTSLVQNQKQDSDENNGRQPIAKKEEPFFSPQTVIAIVVIVGSVIAAYFKFVGEIKDIDHSFDKKTQTLSHKIDKINTKMENLDLQEVENNINMIEKNIKNLNDEFSQYNIKSINESLNQINQDIKDIKIKIEFNSENILSNKKELNKNK